MWNQTTEYKTLFKSNGRKKKVHSSNTNKSLIYEQIVRD